MLKGGPFVKWWNIILTLLFCPGLPMFIVYVLIRIDMATGQSHNDL